MLAEFAMTPGIFDEDAQEDMDLWVEQLRELGATMFPRLAASPVMVADLYEGSWHPETERIVRTIKDHRARRLCQDLLAKMRDSLVFRPARRDWPEDEYDWGMEAVDSCEEEPIERIIATHSGQAKLVGEGHQVRCLSEVTDNGFWSGISAEGTVPMRIADQIELLRKLCVHSEFLCILTPHIYGGSDDETDLVKEVIRSAFRRPRGYRAVVLDIHTEGPNGNPNDSGFATRVANVSSNISNELQQVLSKDQSVNLYLWPNLLHRYIMGGVFTETSDKKQVRSPRWGISIQHFARKRDDPAQAPASWNLLTRDSLLEYFNRYFSEASTGYLSPSPIQISPKLFTHVANES